MKFRARLVAAVLTLALFQLLAVYAHAQNGGILLRQRIYTYGCLSGASPSTEANGRRVFVRTGWDALDLSLLHDITELNRQFGVFVPVYFEATDDPRDKNAYFTNQKFPELLRADGGDLNMAITGSVFITSSLLKDEFNSGGYSVPAILGHEFAHAMQYQNNFPFSGKWQELHADYLAGWFTGHRQRFLPQDASQAMVSFYKKGDFDFFSQGHHGTPQERANAFVAGYTLNRMFNEAYGVRAYHHGINYVRALGAR